MSLGDGGNIMATQSVHEVLRVREKYMGSFREYKGKDKHGNAFPVYQYVQPDTKGLNTAPPVGFSAAAAPLSKLVAYYLLHALRNKESLLTRVTGPSVDYVSIVLLYLWAKASIEESESTPFDRWSISGVRMDAPIREQYDKYERNDYAVRQELAEFIIDYVLRPFRDCFEVGRFGIRMWCFVSTVGEQRLRTEFPALHASAMCPPKARK
jgi:hypothetical protein